MEDLVGKRVEVQGWEERGPGSIIAIDYDEEYSFFILFDDNTLHPEEQTGMFKKSQLNFK